MLVPKLLDGRARGLCVLEKNRPDNIHLMDRSAVEWSGNGTKRDGCDRSWSNSCSLIVATWLPVSLPLRVNTSATIGKLLLLLFSGMRCCSGMSHVQYALVQASKTCMS